MENIIHTRNTQDKIIFREVVKEYGWLDMKDKVVLDIGLNIGAFSRMAIDRGCSAVYGFEPEKENFEYATKNCVSDKAFLFNSAIVPTKEKTVTLYTTPSRKNCGNFSTEHFNGRIPVEVSAENFDEVLDKVKPEVIKIDCEGAEYSILTKPFPDYVKQVAIEIHLTKKLWRNEKAHEIVKLFDGWEAVKQPRIGEKNWTTIGGFRR